MKTITYVLFLSCCIHTFNVHAQTKNNTANVQQSIKELGSLFRKKKKDSTATTTPGVNSTSNTNPTTTGNTPASNTATKAGELSPNVKYIDADQIYPFNAGSGLIRKGASSALIDRTGAYLVPFNTIDLTGIFVAGPVGYVVLYNGIYTYNNLSHNWGGYINAQGKIILKTGLNTGVTEFTDNKQQLRTNNSSPKGVTYTYTLPDGKTYTHPQELKTIVDGIGIVQIKPVGATYYTYTYRKLTGETIAAGFDDAAPFSDGMARVGKADEFGILKFGYINTHGQLVIPCTYSITPGNFSGGYAKVQPRDKSTFEYAFINKTGTIVFKQTLNDTYKNGTFDHFTPYGLAFSEKAILDTTFRLTPKGDFFKSLGLPADSWFVEAGTWTEGETNPKLVFSTRTARGPYTQQPTYGFINWGTKKIVAPVFDLINTNGLYFDPVSHLAYAKICLGRDIKNVPVYREGYINEEGQFVLVKGSGSKW